MGVDSHIPLSEEYQRACITFCDKSKYFILFRDDDWENDAYKILNSAGCSDKDETGIYNNSALVIPSNN